MTTTNGTQWIFPVNDGNDEGLAYVTGVKTGYGPPGHQRPGPTHYFIGANLIIEDSYIPVLKAFLKALDEAPDGTEIIYCRACGCGTVRVQPARGGSDRPCVAEAKLLSANNDGEFCDEHSCYHAAMNPGLVNKETEQ
jgi:hypothetical protein